MQFGKCVDVTHAFFFQYLVDSDQYTSFFHFAEFVVDSRAKYTHRRAQSHVSVDQWGNVEACFAHFGVQDLVVLAECLFGEEFLQLRRVCIQLQRICGINQAVGVVEVLIEEVEDHVACFAVERRIHGHLAKEIL